MRFKYLNGVLLTMFLLTLFGTGRTGVSAQSSVEPPPFTTGQEVQPSDRGQGMEPSSPAIERNRFEVWFKRAGSGLFISLTPFATAVALSILLLVVFVPILIGAKTHKRARGHFKTIPHGR
jgi:hypothetical protein